MARKLIYAPTARDDLEAIRRWLHQPGAGSRAAGPWIAIRRSIQDLRRDPLVWPVGEHPGIRERPTAGYRVMYAVAAARANRATAGDVTILRVFGPGQDRRRL